MSDKPKQNQGRDMDDHKPVKSPPSPPHPIISLLAVPRRHFCFVSSWFFYMLCVALSVIDILFVVLKLTLTYKIEHL